jgi:ferritin-like metal-binding protein YciE
MGIKTAEDLFMHDLGDIYDAEHQFLQGQREMLEQATDPTLKQMIKGHIQQTEGQIEVLEQVYQALGQQPKREPCVGAKGLVSEAKKLFEETKGAPKVRDAGIAGAAAKVEHYEMSAYRTLITGAELMGRSEVVSLLQRNLEQEESTARLIEQNAPDLLQKAGAGQNMQMDIGTGAQASPTY